MKLYLAIALIVLGLFLLSPWLFLMFSHCNLEVCT